MVDIISLPLNRAKVGVSVASYQLADQQRLEIQRAVTQSGQASVGVDSVQAAGPGRELQALREAARAQRVEQMARQDQANTHSESRQGESSARRGQTVDIEA